MVQTHWSMSLLGHHKYLVGVRTGEWMAGDDGRGTSRFAGVRAPAGSYIFPPKSLFLSHLVALHI